MVKIGTQSVVGLRLGGQQIGKAYLGSELVFGAVPGPAVCTITASIDPAGSGTVSGAGQYQEGDSVTLKAVPGDGYQFTGWQENGQTVSEAAEYTFVVAEDRALVGVFEVSKPSRLPPGYTELQYIHSSSNCAIDTGISLGLILSKRIVLDIQADAYPGSIEFIAGCYYTSSTDAFRLLRTSQAQFYSDKLGYTTRLNVSNTSKRAILDWDFVNRKISFDGVSNILSDVYPNASRAANIFIFDPFYSVEDATVKTKLYSAKIYNYNSLVRDFVPCKNPSGAVGLYDLIGGAFYANIGTGAITAGPAV